MYAFGKIQVLAEFESSIVDEVAIGQVLRIYLTGKGVLYKSMHWL